MAKIIIQADSGQPVEWLNVTAEDLNKPEVIDEIMTAVETAEEIDQENS